MIAKQNISADDFILYRVGEVNHETNVVTGSDPAPVAFKEAE